MTFILELDHDQPQLVWYLLLDPTPNLEEEICCKSGLNIDTHMNTNHKIE